MKRWNAILVVLVVLCAPSLGFAGAGEAGAGDEKLSEVEKLKVEKAQLLATIAQLQGDRGEWRTNFSQCIATLGRLEATQGANNANTFGAGLIKEIEEAHKGYTLNDKGELVKKEK